MPALLYAGLLVLLGVGATRQCLSHYFSDSAFLTGVYTEADQAIRFEAESPDAYKTQGVLYLRNGDYIAATAAFEKAISLRGNDFLLWLRLGYSRLHTGNVDGAYAAYQTGLSLAPKYSQPNYYIGKLLFDNGQTSQAFQFLSKAAKYDHTLYPEILHFARVTFPGDPDSIQRVMDPASIEEKKIVASYLIGHDLMTDNLKIFLVSNELTEVERKEFVDLLISKQQFSAAREIWLSKLSNADGIVTGTIFDGGFEHLGESESNSFGWQIDQKVSAISFVIDEQNFHSGTRSLRVKFSGIVDFDRKLISQLIDLRPGRKYQLNFFFRAKELVSAGLPAVAIIDAKSNQILGRSQALQVTGDKWIEASVPFSSIDASAAYISLQRSPCNTSPCPIFGEINLDDFSLDEN